MVHDASLERSFRERLRVASLTLWLPIIILAILPVAFLAGIDFFRFSSSGVVSITAAVASSDVASHALTLGGGILLGGWFVYTLLWSDASSVSSHHVAAVTAAVLGATANSLGGSNLPLILAPSIVVAFGEFFFAVRATLP
jgi:hypothetical protein